MKFWLLFIPLSSAFSCWLFTRLFIYFIFHPRKRLSFLGIPIQGLIPAKRSSLAMQTGKMIAENFFSPDLIEEKISDPATLQKIMPFVEEHVDDFLRNKLKKEMPFIGMFIGDKTINTLKSVFIKELEVLFPALMRKYASHLVTDLNIQQVVTEKIENLSITEVERTFQRNLSKEIKMAQYISIITGLLIGVLTMLIPLFIK